MSELWALENEIYAEGFDLICGVDEAGRGPLAGPVCAAAVILPRGIEIAGLNDSKKLTDKKREALYDVICEKPYEFKSDNQTISQSNNFPRVVCYDFGVKTNILRSLAKFARVTVVPAKTPAEEVLKMKPDGVFLSNGPADPAAVTYAQENIKKLLAYHAAIQQSSKSKHENCRSLRSNR